MPFIMHVTHANSRSSEAHTSYSCLTHTRSFMSHTHTPLQKSTHVLNRYVCDMCHAVCVCVCECVCVCVCVRDMPDIIVEYVWHDSSQSSMTWPMTSSNTRDMTYFILHMCDMTQPIHVWHDPSYHPICVTWLIHFIHGYVWRDICLECMCVMNGCVSWMDVWEISRILFLMGTVAVYKVCSTALNWGRSRVPRAFFIKIAWMDVGGMSKMHVCDIHDVIETRLLCHVTHFIHRYVSGDHFIHRYVRHDSFHSYICATWLISWVDVCGIYERWGAGVETQKNVRGEIGGWGRVPFNEPYVPSLSTIYDGA